jgi:hypothetical protein
MNNNLIQDNGDQESEDNIFDIEILKLHLKQKFIKILD